MWLAIRLLLAGFLRYWLIHTEYWHTISNSVEVATSLNSWKRLVEGVYLYDKNIDPYDGDAFHESPIILVLFHWLLKNCPFIIPALFTIIDLATSCFLYSLAKNYMTTLAKTEEAEKDSYAEDARYLQVTNVELKEAPEYVLSLYLFSPFSVLNCVGLTTTVLQNFFLSGALWAALRGRSVMACSMIALATHQALYPVTLIVPISIMISQARAGCAKCSYIRTLLLFVLCWSFLVYVSAHIMDGSYKYIYSTYGFILTVPDLKPNIGLFWYFFMEMFEHFRLLFICAFQINALILYIVPLTLRFSSEPMLLATTLVALAGIFRSYPCIGDVALYTALYPLWKHLLPFMQQKFVVGITLALSGALAPATWHLWIYSRAANANFFFGATLCFATAQIFLITDLLFAHVRRAFALKHGFSREIDVLLLLLLTGLC